MSRTPGRLPRRRQWRPIKTAPKDGTRIRVFIPYDPASFDDAECEDSGWWEPLEEVGIPEPLLGDWYPQWGIEAGGCWRFEGDDGAYDLQPIMWCPLEYDP